MPDGAGALETDAPNGTSVRVPRVPESVDANRSRRLRGVDVPTKSRHPGGRGQVDEAVESAGGPAMSGDSAMRLGAAQPMSPISSKRKKPRSFLAGSRNPGTNSSLGSREKTSQAVW